MDGNSGFGYHTVDHSKVLTQSSALGGHNLAVENSNGKIIREFMESWNFVLATTFSPSEPTYYGPLGASTHIDHVAVPQSLWHSEHMGHTVTLVRQGRRVQLIKHALLRDHMPV
eukprot:1506124-Alexandrium_andersonii.AAC.1